MFKQTQLIQFNADTSLARCAEVYTYLQSISRTTGIVRGFAAPTLPGALNGGDLIWHLQFDDEVAYTQFRAGDLWRSVEEMLQPLAANIECVGYVGGDSGVRAPSLQDGVYRTLLVSATQPQAAEKETQLVAQFTTLFTQEILAMPQYIDGIRNWQLSRVSYASGTRRWTHVWEQEFDDLAALQQQYMQHPYHWAHVDRWFDWESPDWLIDRHMCHTFCRLDASVLAAVEHNPAENN